MLKFLVFFRFVAGFQEIHEADAPYPPRHLDLEHTLLTKKLLIG